MMGHHFTVVAPKRRVTVTNPVLPAGIGWLGLKDIPFTGGRFSLRFERSGSWVSFATIRADDGISIERMCAGDYRV